MNTPLAAIRDVGSESGEWINGANALAPQFYTGCATVLQDGLPAVTLTLWTPFFPPPNMSAFNRFDSIGSSSTANRISPRSTNSVSSIDEPTPQDGEIRG